ncbi:MAG TPA: hypothetical protein PLR99_04070 [Polyangiaceae bacterium]|nr:hypothetical protein [Polyangiaceae bacterium]
MAGLLVVVTGSPPARAEAPDDVTADLEASRARFKRGMDLYVSGEYAGAIVTWEAIYAELGPERGYRLAFNIARAYDAFGDPSRAAEGYAAYLHEVSRRRALGEALPELVEKQARDAEARVGELQRTRGKLRVPEGPVPVEVRVDGGAPRLAGFVALLPPGRHVVVFGVGASSTRHELVLEAGEESTLVPPAPPRDRVAEGAPRPRPAPRPEVRTVRPFSAVWIYVAAGTAAVSVLLPALQYGRALSTASQHDASGDALERERLAADYASQKSAAYASVALPVALAAATAGLGLVYVVGARTETVRVSPQGLGLAATFTY